MKEFWKANQWKIASFAMVSVIGWMWMIFRDSAAYEYDSGYYWTIADPVYEKGILKMNILNFPETFRGCNFTLLLGFIKTFMVHFKLYHQGWWIFFTASCAFFFAIILPELLRFKIQTFSHFLRINILFGFFLLIWGDIVRYPLSDLPAALFLCGGVVLLKRIVEDSAASLRKEIVAGIAAGFLLYNAYNTRAAFLYGALLVCVVFLSRIWKNFRMIWTVCGILLGIVLAMIPQVMINYKYVGRVSPKVYTEQIDAYSQDLQTQQVLWGMGYSRFEGYVGEDEGYPKDMVYFIDKAGVEIAGREGLNINHFRYSDFFRLFFKYPLDMTGIYVRHFISLMTPLYRDLYIYSLSVNKEWIVTVSVLIWYVAAYYFFVCAPLSLRKLEWVIPCIVPAVLQLVGAPELRFFLPVYLIVYGYVFLKIDYRVLWNTVRKYPVNTVISFLAVYAVWVTIIGDILASNAEMTLLIHH